VSLGALYAAFDVARRNRVLLRKLEPELIEGVARNALFDVWERKLLQQVVEHAVAGFHGGSQV
jgi:hypothetical protein